MRIALCVLATGAVAACASAGGLDAAGGRPLRYGPECAAARERARLAPDSAVIAPTLVALVVPPLPVPAGVQGDTAQVTVRVDSTGTVALDGVRVAGVRDARYAAQLRATVARMRFRPAALGTCAVEGTARLSYAL